MLYGKIVHMKHIFAFGNNAFGQIDSDLFHNKHKTIINVPHELDLTGAGESLPGGSTSSSVDEHGEILIKKICKSSWSNLFFITTNGLLYTNGLQGKTCGVSSLVCSHVGGVDPSWNHTYVAKTQIAHGGISVFTGCEWKNSQDVEGTFKLDQDTVNVTQLSAGELHVVALTDTGHTLEIEEDKNQCFIYKSLDLHYKVKAVSCGKEHVLLLSRIGTVFTYGIGSRGQLGNGTTNKQDVPQVIEALEGISVTAVAAGGWHSCVLTDIGDLYVWGWNEMGQLALPSKSVHQDGALASECINIQTVPRLVDIVCDKEVEVVAVSCGSRHSAALTGEGLLYTWGWNAYGQLGLGDEVTRDKPNLVHLPGYFVTDVVCGFWNTVISCLASPSPKCQDSST